MANRRLAAGTAVTGAASRAFVFGAGPRAFVFGAPFRAFVGGAGSRAFVSGAGSASGTRERLFEVGSAEVAFSRKCLWQGSSALDARECFIKYGGFRTKE